MFFYTCWPSFFSSCNWKQTIIFYFLLLAILWGYEFLRYDFFQFHCFLPSLTSLSLNLKMLSSSYWRQLIDHHHHHLDICEIAKLGGPPWDGTSSGRAANSTRIRESILATYRYENQFLSLNCALCPKCLSVYYIWFSQVATNLHPWVQKCPLGQCSEVSRRNWWPMIEDL